MKVSPLPADGPATLSTPTIVPDGNHEWATPVPTMIDALHHSGIITAHHVAAARFWATDYRIGVMGQEDPYLDRTSLGLSVRPLNGRMGSINRYRYIHDIIGNRYERILIATMINNQSLEEIASHVHYDPRHMGSVLALLLDFLTRHYDAMPGHLWRG
ncbi:hypothetical protein [Komagataeibacter swingsii]|uniref:hypothetical protein n=1 Tax=Komagataeibacter swingsii TaxID=215220 RepID=UPI001FC9B12F|nr:hypothetical protein [Komagataeibacter swingsii]